jgi:hypothetical protein
MLPSLKNSELWNTFTHIDEQLAVVCGIERGKEGNLNLKFKLKYCLHAPFLKAFDTLLERPVDHLTAQVIFAVICG